MNEICLINCSNPINTSIEWDEYVDYRDGLLLEDNNLKRCTSWHSIPACLGTEFFVLNKPKWEGVYKYPKIILLINRDLEHVEPLIKKLKLMGKKIAIGHHEGTQDFLQAAMNLNWLVKFKELVDQCDYYWNVIPQYDVFFRDLFNKQDISIPHAAPYQFSHKWEKPLSEKSGVLIGTRTLNQRLNRNTLISLAHMKFSSGWGWPVTYVNEDHVDIKPFFEKLRMEKINVVSGPFSFTEWLHFVSNFRVMVHADASMNLGQLALDCAMVGTVLVGGDTYYNRITGTHMAGHTSKLKLLVKDYMHEAYDNQHALWVKNMRDWTNFDEIKAQILSKFI